MRYWILAGVSAFAAYALFAAAGSAAARLVFRRADELSEGWAPARRARLLLVVRLLPAIAAATASFGIALPVFLWFEDGGTSEPVSLTLAAIALAGAALLARGVWRAAAAWRSTRHVLAAWQRRSRALDGLAVAMPAYAIDEPFPIVAIAGIRSPRLFVAERVLRECTPREIAAMVAHECAHVSAADNLKRLLIRACPDVFATPRRLDRAWSAATEEAADARAGVAPSVRLDLAHALIHVARLATPTVPPLASAFYLGGSIENRVRRLVDPPSSAAPRPWTRVALATAALAAVAAIVAAAPALHALMEEAVRHLP